MGQTLDQKLANAQKKRDIAAAALQTKKLEKRLTVLNKYDAVQPDAGRRRRSAVTETEPEEKILPVHQRHKGISLARDLERNYSNAKSMTRQVKINTVGCLGKLRLNLKDDKETNEAVAGWFNGTYAKNCDARGDNHLSDFFKLGLMSVIREGDVLFAFDDFFENDGRIWSWEADQLVTINKKDWEGQTEWVEQVNGKTVAMQQCDGVITDRLGRTHAYAVTNKRGLSTARLDEVMIIKKESARLLFMPWRLNQQRGTADMLPMIGDMEDNYEMRAKELQTAKVAASMAGLVKKKDGFEEVMVANGLGPEEIIYDDADPGTQAPPEKTYDRFGKLTGGYIEYLEQDDEFELLKVDRPNLDAAKFHDFILQSSGGSLGLAKAYSLLVADRSYTAFRGEMVMTWESFYDYQKWLERRLADWLAIKAITRAVEQGELAVKLPDGWQDKISWIWPEMPQIDPVKDNAGKEKGLSNGLTDYSQLLGPDWRDKFDALAEQIAYAEEKGLPLKAFQQKEAAAPAAPAPRPQRRVTEPNRE